MVEKHEACRGAASLGTELRHGAWTQLGFLFSGLLARHGQLFLSDYNRRHLAPSWKRQVCSWTQGLIVGAPNDEGYIHLNA